MHKKKSILVVFDKDLPKKKTSWFKQFNEVLSGKELNAMIMPGSIHEANRLAQKLPNIATLDGKTLPKSVIYKGFEIWWAHYDDIYYSFCLPYTQYHLLLEYLKNFEKIYLYQPLWPKLFRYYLKAHNCQCVILKENKLGNLLPIPLGIVIQILLSFIFLPLLIIKRPKVMFWTSDKFAPPHKHDFRMGLIYDELAKNKLSFVEFIRSSESWKTVLSHALARKRPVFYPAALIQCLYGFTKFFYPPLILRSANKNSEEHFWFLTATHYLRNIKGTILAIMAMKFILQLIGIKAAITHAACNRTIHEILGCKLAGIKTVGIQHGATTKYYFVSDFMQGFSGVKPLSVDRYGLWSEWWRNYYIENSQAYKPEQLFVSGPMRPLIGKKYPEQEDENKNRLRVLYISEGLAVPEEVLPFISAILEINDFDLYFKFRPYRDYLESWLRENKPELYREILEKTKILRGTMEEAVNSCDVAVGSHSTAVLEALFQLKPFVFFLTNKWGDYFNIKASGLNYFFSETPAGLIERIKKSREISKKDLKELQEKFFGDPYRNGSKWMVDQILDFLRQK